MSYFTEIEDGKTYAGRDDDFHFIYNANKGGGQSFLGGKYKDADGNLFSPATLNGYVGVLNFPLGGKDGSNGVKLEDTSTQYEIKPRATGDNNMKLSVGNKPTPSSAVAAFLMLPETCGVKRSEDKSLSVLGTRNFWVHSMWLAASVVPGNKVLLTLKDCVLCGGIDKDGAGEAKYFTVDFRKRIDDVIAASKCTSLKQEVLSCIGWFADVYRGTRKFVFQDAIATTAMLMRCLASNYPDRYSGKIDPLSFVQRLVLESKDDPNKADVDRLSIAVRAFKAHRTDADWSKTDCPASQMMAYQAVNTGVREYFGKLTVTKVAAFGLAELTELFTGVKGPDGKVVFEPMWSGKIGQGWPHILKAFNADEQKVVAFLVGLATSSASLSSFAAPGFERPGGFGGSVISELLMKFHPTEAFKYGGKTADALKVVGLQDYEPHPANFKQDEYDHVFELAKKIKVELAKAGVTRCLDDVEQPDFLTVNEFLDWVYGHQDLIKEEAMKRELKPVNSAARVKTGGRKLAAAFTDDMMRRLAAALRTKPFAILAGHSGTGKSQLVRRLAYMTCNNDDLIKEGVGKTSPGNYCMVQVKPNWHDSTDLLGYYSDLNGRHFVNTPFLQFLCKAYAYPETPFFLCLDEMNLAPVEQYFAEYLSAVESLEKKDGVWLSDPLVEVVRTNEKDEKGHAKPDAEILSQVLCGAASQEAADWIAAHGVTIPKNLFVVGTVNMDETTCQFSRKVLDRAMTLLMNKVEFGKMKDALPPNQEELLDPDGIAFFLDGERTGSVGADEAAALDKVNAALANTPFVVAYRFANEYALYEEALKKLDPAATPQTALDDVVLMKLLPRIHGMKDAVVGIFEGRKAKGSNEKDVPGLKETVPADGKSVEMMDQVLRRSDDYLTFWP